MILRWTCDGCGRLAHTLKAVTSVAEKVDVTKYTPVVCGFCRGTTFTKHEAAA